MDDLTRPKFNLPKALAGAVAALLATLALLGPLALVPSQVSAAQPSGNEYQLNLPGDGNGNSNSDSGGSSALVPIAIGAAVLTVIAVLVLVRYRRQED